MHVQKQNVAELVEYVRTYLYVLIIYSLSVLCKYRIFGEVYVCICQKVNRKSQVQDLKK